jgi:hypothetical protein
MTHIAVQEAVGRLDSGVEALDVPGSVKIRIELIKGGKQ